MIIIFVFFIRLDHISRRVLVRRQLDIAVRVLCGELHLIAIFIAWGRVLVAVLVIIIVIIAWGLNYIAIIIESSTIGSTAMIAIWTVSASIFSCSYCSI